MIVDLVQEREEVRQVPLQRVRPALGVRPEVLGEEPVQQRGVARGESPSIEAAAIHLSRVLAASA